MSNWPRVPLGELVTQIDRAESVRPDGQYRLLGVRLEGNGAFHRETVLGTETSASRLSRANVGDFIYSRLFAWRGAFGLIGQDLDGCFVSNEFPLFKVDESRLNAEYLNRWFQLPATWRRVEEDCTGSTPTTRNRFKEEFFRKLQVPLPPLAEQKAIVVHLNALSERASQLTARLDAIYADASALIVTLHHHLSKGNAAPLSEFLELHEEPVSIKPGKAYPQVGVRSFGGGLFSKAAVSASDTTYRAFNRLYTDAIVLSQVKGWEGAIALTPSPLAGMFASPEYRTFRCRAKIAVPGYIGELFKTPWFWSLLQGATHGVGARRERTRPEKFLSTVLPMPSFEKQLEACQLFAHLRAVKNGHAAIRADNDALLPSVLNQIFAR